MFVLNTFWHTKELKDLKYRKEIRYIYNLNIYIFSILKILGDPLCSPHQTYSTTGSLTLEAEYQGSGRHQPALPALAEAVITAVEGLAARPAEVSLMLGEEETTGGGVRG